MVADNAVYGPGSQPSTYGRQDGNFDNFIDNWRHYKDRLVVFLGAGASIGAHCDSGATLPTALGLRDELWQEFMLNGAPLDPKNLGLLSLEHSAALVEAKIGRQPLVEYVAKRFKVVKPLWPHAALPFFRPSAIYTTNYDELVELGWQLHPDLPRLSPIFSPTQVHSSGWTPLYKPHGTAQHASGQVGEGGVVLTQFDYFKMLTKRREMLESFLEQMESACVLFIGYSFQDMDVASILYALRSRARERHWYAVFPRADDNVRSMYNNQYGIRQISRTFADFVAEAGERLKLVPAAWHSELPLAPVESTTPHP